jgi:hypothetical protein
MPPEASCRQRASIAMGRDEVDRFLRDRMAKGLALRIEIETVVSWDHRKLVRGAGVRDR